ncbi:hypothetical protein [Candidatus Oleimmundimicrobium sp.]|uniref:hypothetical protein n=1 Tax=Candidatus Oleimmundimicrobium sp. TaxID=3060597 RepID=UPI0027248EBA|nr:hypothetical protein [Candidatus Oleimmundimicrobium sp.]MDO8885729.1 hypothetical protein [Candidatus Oleimmundimicrobium sp.]
MGDYDFGGGGTSAGRPLKGVGSDPWMADIGGRWTPDQIGQLQREMVGWGYLQPKKYTTGVYDKNTRQAHMDYFQDRYKYSREFAESPYTRPVSRGGGGGGGYSLGKAIAREKQQRAHPYLNAPFLADLEMTYRKTLDREITASEKKFLLNKYINEGWDMGSVQNYLARTPEFKTRESKTKMQVLGDELGQMWRTITGTTPAEANIGWAIQKADKEFWGQEKFQSFLRSTPTFRLRYPDIPDTMSVDDYDNFARQANSISLTYGKGPITTDKIKELLQKKSTIVQQTAEPLQEVNV